MTSHTASPGRRSSHSESQDAEISVSRVLMPIKIRKFLCKTPKRRANGFPLREAIPHLEYIHEPTPARRLMPRPAISRKNQTDVCPTAATDLHDLSSWRVHIRTGAGGMTLAACQGLQVTSFHATSARAGRLRFPDRSDRQRPTRTPGHDCTQAGLISPSWSSGFPPSPVPCLH